MGGGRGSPPKPLLTLEAISCPRPGGKVMEASSSTTSAEYRGLLGGERGWLGQTDTRTRDGGGVWTWGVGHTDTPGGCLDGWGGVWAQGVGGEDVAR